jgi:ribosome-associated protein YbcJ (S4-like RNA binding protein)
LFLRTVLQHDSNAESQLRRGTPLAAGDRIECKGELIPALHTANGSSAR